MTFISPFTPVYSGHQNADIVRTWSQAGSGFKNSVAAIHNLHKAGASLHLQQNKFGESLGPVDTGRQIAGVGRRSLCVPYPTHPHQNGELPGRACRKETIQWRRCAKSSSKDGLLS